MSGMLESVNDFVETTVGNVPLAVLTIALLATPTILYVIYRLSVPAVSHGRSRTSATPAAQWVCPSCHSVNDLTSRRCYRCAFDVDRVDDVLVIDPLTAKPITLPPLDDPRCARTARGPGRAGTGCPGRGTHRCAGCPGDTILRASTRRDARSHPERVWVVGRPGRTRSCSGTDPDREPRPGHRRERRSTTSVRSGAGFGRIGDACRTGRAAAADRRHSSGPADDWPLRSRGRLTTTQVPG